MEIDSAIQRQMRQLIRRNSQRKVACDKNINEMEGNRFGNSLDTLLINVRYGHCNAFSNSNVKINCPRITRKVQLNLQQLSL